MAETVAATVTDASTPFRGGPETSDRLAALLGVAILAAWLAIVLTTVARHEYWCDEVRALSIARLAHSPLELIRLLKNDGHPILWYAILALGNFIGRPSWILPVASVSIAAGAVMVFVFCSPFARWFQALFVFSFLPVYEYSVMARNYGLTMLMIFLFAWLYPRRQRRPWLPAVILFLMANSHFMGTIAAAALSFMWLLDTNWRAGVRNVSRETLFPMLIVLAGAALAYVTVAPAPGTTVTHLSTTTWRDVLRCVPLMLLPFKTFGTLIPQVLLDAAHRNSIGRLLAEVGGNLVIWAAVLGLAFRPRLLVAAVAMMVASGLFSSLVYPSPSPRHQGIFLILLLALYWMAMGSDQAVGQGNSWRHCAMRWGLYGVMGLIILGYYPLTYQTVGYDLLYWRSVSKPFAGFLASSREYRDAVLIPEPGTEAEAMPYYCDNLIYLPREERFGTVNRYQNMTPQQGIMSLGTLLDRAERVRASTGKPVLLMLHDTGFLTQPSGDVVVDWGSVVTHFSWTPQERLRLAHEAKQVVDLTQTRALETYVVFALR